MESGQIYLIQFPYTATFDFIYSSSILLKMIASFFKDSYVECIQLKPGCSRVQDYRLETFQHICYS